jgi:hypothetical protein
MDSSFRSHSLSYWLSGRRRARLIGLTIHSKRVQDSVADLDPDLFGVCKSHKYLRNLCFLTFWVMAILFRAYFRQKNFRRNLAENLFRSGSGSGTGSGRFRKLDPDPVKNRPSPQPLVQGYKGTPCFLNIKLNLTIFL